MIENSLSDAALRKEQCVFTGMGCVEYMVGVTGTVPYLMHLSPRLLFHTLYYHSESERRVRLQQRPYYSLSPTSSAVHLCARYCASLLCGKQNSIK